MYEAYTALISSPEVAVMFFVHNFSLRYLRLYLYTYFSFLVVDLSVNIYSNWLQEQSCNLSL